MGLAASQARLLSLTSRQHTVELRAQYYQAQKLRLANDSDSAYERYITALDATKYQTKFYSSDKKLHWVDASLNNLMRLEDNYNGTGNTYYAQNIDNGLLYTTNRIKTAYDESSNVTEFLEKFGITYTQEHSQEYLYAEAKVNADIELGWDQPIDVNFLKNYYAIIDGTIPTVENEDLYNAAIAIKTELSDGLTNGIYTNTNGFSTLNTNINTIFNSNYFENISNEYKILNYYKNFEDPIIAKEDELQVGNPTSEIEPTSVSVKAKGQEYINNFSYQKESIALNGGNWSMKYKVLANGDPNAFAPLNEASGEVYDENIQGIINTYNNTTEYSNVAQALIKMCNNIIEGYDPETSNTNYEYTDMDELLEAYGYSSTEEVEIAIAHHNEYLEDYKLLQSTDQSLHDVYLPDQLKGEHYTEIYNAIKAAGGCIAISDENAKNGAWITNMVKNVQVILTKYNKEENDLDTISVSQNGGLREISNDEDLKRAENEYDTILDEITEKEKKYDIKLSQLEAERNAIETEKESLKQIANDNIDSTFRLFS